MTRLRALPERPAGSTVGAIPIDYARDTLEELTAPVQRWQHHFALDTIPLAIGEAARVPRARRATGRVVGSPRRLANG